MRRLALAAMLALLAAAMPATASPVQGCPQGWESGVLVDGRGVCLKLEVENPGALVPNPLLPTTRACNVPGMNGVNTTVWGGSYVMVCANAGATMPNGSCQSVRDCFQVIIEQCGPGVDPTILVFGGSVYACGAVVHSVGKEVPPVTLDLRPCPGGFDPKVGIGNTTVEFCLIMFR